MRWEASLKVGVLVIVAGILLVILLTMASDWVVGVPGKELTIYFESLNGLKRGAWVHLSGIAVGKVIDIYLDREGNAVVIARIESPVPLRQGLKARLGTLGFIGEAYIELTNGPTTNPLFTDWTTPIRGETMPDPSALVEELRSGLERVVAFVDVAEKALTETQEDVHTATVAADRFMGRTSAQIDRFLTETKPLVDELSKTLALLEERLPTLLDRSEALLAETSDEVTSVSAETKRVVAGAQDWMEETRSETRMLLENANAAATQLRAVLDEMSDEAKALRAELSGVASETKDVLTAESKRLNESLARLDEGIAAADALLKRLDRVVARVEEGEGTVGRLLNEDTLLPKVDTTLDSANRVIQRLDRVAQTVEQATEETPTLDVGVDVTYRSTVDGLRNEFGLLFRPNPRQSLLGAVSMHHEKTLYSLVLAQRVGPLWGRLGFIDSEASLGLDWEVKDWLTLRGEARNVTRPFLNEQDAIQWPRFDVQAIVAPTHHVRLVFGGEDVGDEIGFILGIRAGY